MMHAPFLRIKGLSQKTTRSKDLASVMTRVMKHNLREIAAEIGVRDGSKIDPKRIKDNVILIGGNTAEKVDGELKSLMGGVCVSKWRKDTISAVEIVSSLPIDSGINPLNYFSDSVKWAASFFNVPIISAVIHLDEDVPHCHVILIPVVNNKLLGTEVMGDRKQISEMQTAYYKTVAKAYGLSPHLQQKRHSAEIRAKAIELLFNSFKRNSGLDDSVINGMLVPHFKNPAPLMEIMGIQMPLPKIKVKTSTAIFIQKTKPDMVKSNRLTTIGVENLKLNSIPIEVEPDSQSTSMLCIEVQFPCATNSINIHSNPVQVNEHISDAYVRERDNDILATHWNCETGEYVKPSTSTSSKLKIVESVKFAIVQKRQTNF